MGILPVIKPTMMAMLAPVRKPVTTLFELTNTSLNHIPDWSMRQNSWTTQEGGGNSAMLSRLKRLKSSQTVRNNRIEKTLVRVV